ncbi:hypothetical protein A3765_12795 [Oleiphilus sp. HI0130]|nr:hypothetical protein A3765_12795 [Oleiphilus sp. HI0130]
MTTSVDTDAAPSVHVEQESSNKAPSIKLKASLAPMTALEISDFDPAHFEQELSAKVAQAPGFFENLPVVIGLEKYASSSLDFEQLLGICKAHSVKAIGVRGASLELQEQARAFDLGILAKQKEKSPAYDSDELAAPEPAPAPEAQTIVQASKVIQHPIRSGQQVYAADGDLIILASVSAGAEILADGNIHVYGTLRGRALAGVKGNMSARVFCHSMAAELVSVAGQYKISEDIPSSALGKPCQVYLEDESLKFKELEF